MCYTLVVFTRTVDQEFWESWLNIKSTQEKGKKH
jgi:hypothetical protein